MIEEHIAYQRSAIADRLRRLLGGDGQPVPVGQALMLALTRPLAESGLVVQPPSSGGRPIVATSAGGRASGRLLLLSHSDATAAALPPGGARAGLIAALAALRASGTALPVEVILVCEADRSTGSASLERLGLLPADYCLWDGGGYSGEPARPWLALGSHGLLRLRLQASGAGGPVNLGAVIVNPAWRLIWALAALKSSGEALLAPGLYETVRAPTAEEATMLAEGGALERALLERHGGQPLLGLHDAQLALVRAFSPGLSITGLGLAAAAPSWLPTSAWAELTLLLVPEQQPAALLTALRRQLERSGLGDVTIEPITGYAGRETPGAARLVRLIGRLIEEAGGGPARQFPFGEYPAPLDHLVSRAGGQAVGIGPGRAAWPELEGRVLRQARLVAESLRRLAEPELADG
jgi:acetylornithine deacetylase/succinyl-diaminopimelate desuccinylase-like protein